MDYLSNFIESIQDLMIKNNLNISLFSKKTGCANAAVSRWLNKTYWPTMECVVKISAAFDISIDFLFGISDNTTIIRNENPDTFLNNLSILMKRSANKNITLYSIAKACRIGNSAVSKWKKAKKLPKTENIIALALYFDCSIDFLVGR